MKTSKILKSLFLIIGCSLTGSSQSQIYKDFDLSSFITPDIVRNELDFSLNSSGNIRDYQAKSNDYASLNADFGTDLFRIKNSRPYKGSQKLSFIFNGTYQNDKFNNEKKRNRNITLSYNSDNRFYKPNKLFFGLSGNAYVNHNGYTNKTVKEDKNKANTALVYLGVGVGKGRIEPVTDARQAIYILDNLSKKGILERKLTNEEILALAKEIAIVKNKRFFDSRLRLIDEITEVDSFFVNNGLLKSSGASYFTTLYDYWMYGDRFERSAGLEFYAGLGGFYQHHFNKQNENEPFRENRYQPLTRLTLSMTYEKPVNLYWQHSAYLSLLGEYSIREANYYTDKKAINKYDDYATTLTGYYKWGYYPTSRTNINFGIQELLGWNGSKIRNDGDDLTGSLNSETNVNLAIYYYFSPQLRLATEANAGIYCSKWIPSVYENDKFQVGWRGNFMLTLTYSLF